jgi:hypothetical protein
MELAIPIIALGSLYLASNQSQKEENFDTMGRQTLPNTNLPNRNYPAEFPVRSYEHDQTSKLSTVNKYDTPYAYTDKYFNPSVNPNIINPQAPAEMDSINAIGGLPGAGSTASSSKYYSLTGNKVDSSYFQHNNMVPFFGGSMRSRLLDENATESLLDSMQGAGSQIFNKKEQSPLFAPSDNTHFTHGMPSHSDFIQSRMNVGMKMSNVKPFLEERVAPGLGCEGSNGYNSGMMARDLWMPKTADEMRVANKPKASGHTLLGHEGPAMSRNPQISTTDVLGRVEKNRPERTFDFTPDRYLTNVGEIKAQPLNGTIIDRPVNRATTSVEYSGIAAASNPATYVEGEYMPSKHIDLGELPLGIASAGGKGGAYDADYGIKSKMAYPNNRTTTRNDDYFGAIGGAFGAAVAPLLDVLRPSRKENAIGTLRPYQNPKSEVANSYLFDPTDRPSHTIRETTEQSKGHLFVNSGQNEGAYHVTGHQVAPTYRHDHGAYNYTGGASAGESTRQPRPYDAEYNQRNNDIKSSTINGRLVPGNMSLMNGEVNMRQKQMDNFLLNNRSAAPNLPYQIPDAHTMGALQGHGNQLYSGIHQDRNTPDIMNALKSNPYTLSVTDAFK